MATAKNLDETKSTGGVAPFGYRWQNGSLVVDRTESPVRRLIYELFIKHRRKKTVARLLNELGHRTRSGSPFSDTTVDRLLRDPAAKGIKITGGAETAVEAIISDEIWERANELLKTPQMKQPVQLFAGFAYCECGGKMSVPSDTQKYVCAECRHKIPAVDLEEIFSSQLKDFLVPAESSGAHQEMSLAEHWLDLSAEEKRTVAEQLLGVIVAGKREIRIEFACAPELFKTPTFGQRNERGNETAEPMSTVAADRETAISMTEPLFGETDAAKFLGISRMTLLRKRNAGEIKFFRVGFRVLYSKEKHLLPFLEMCEK